MFGLHPNAEIDFRTKQSDSLYQIVSELQPKAQLPYLYPWLCLALALASTTELPLPVP